MSDASDHTGDPAAATVDDERVRRVEAVIGRLLRWGVLASLSLVVAGTVVGFLRPADGYGTTADDVRRLTGPAGAFPRSIGWVAAGVRDGRGPPLIVAGLTLLLATPVIRVAVSVVAYSVQRDRAFVLITAGVLGLLVLSLVLGRATD